MFECGPGGELSLARSLACFLSRFFGILFVPLFRRVLLTVGPGKRRAFKDDRFVPLIGAFSLKLRASISEQFVRKWRKVVVCRRTDVEKNSTLEGIPGGERR